MIRSWSGGTILCDNSSESSFLNLSISNVSVKEEKWEDRGYVEESNASKLFESDSSEFCYGDDVFEADSENSVSNEDHRYLVKKNQDSRFEGNYSNDTSSECRAYDDFSTDDEYCFSHKKDKISIIANQITCDNVKDELENKLISKHKVKKELIGKTDAKIVERDKNEQNKREIIARNQQCKGHVTVSDNVRSQHQPTLPLKYGSYELQRFEAQNKKFVQNIIEKRNEGVALMELVKEKAKERRKKLTARILQQIREGKKGKISFASIVDAKKEKPEKSLKLILSSDEVSTMASRLCKRASKEHISVFLPRGDYNTWKRQNGLHENQLIFSMTGWYPSLRKALIERGWHLNSEKGNCNWDLKWSLKSSDIKFDDLRNDQMINHFKGSFNLTTKTGLLHILRKTSFFGLHFQNEDAFFPRSYDLADNLDRRCFLDDYYSLHAEVLLKKLMINKANNSNSRKVNIGFLKVMLSVLRKKNRQLTDDEFIDDNVPRDESCVTEIQIEILNNSEWLYRAVTTRDFELSSPKERGIDDNHLKENKDQKAINRRHVKVEKQRKKVLEDMSQVYFLSEKYIIEIDSVLEKLEHMKQSSSQNELNGKISNNLWVLKPSGKSRGRGVRVLHSVEDIFQHVHTPNNGKPDQWVVQKYIENCMTIAGRKFDIRQWVLVTGWNPLTIWFYNDCYVRFAVEKYDDPQEKSAIDSEVNKEWVKDKYIHLVNNSIARKSVDFKNDFFVENGKKVVGHMWSLQDFSEWLTKKEGKDVWESSLLPSIKSIVIDSIRCAQEGVVGRSNSWEIFGYDFMIDIKLRPWLIEINSSPACDYSTYVAESFVKKVLPDVLKVVLDICQRNSLTKKLGHSSNSKNKNTIVDSGDWIQIYRGPEVSAVVARLGVGITLNGEKMSTKKLNFEKSKKQKIFSASTLPHNNQEGKENNSKFGCTDVPLTMIEQNENKSVSTNTINQNEIRISKIPTKNKCVDGFNFKKNSSEGNKRNKFLLQGLRDRKCIPLKIITLETHI